MGRLLAVLSGAVMGCVAAASSVPHDGLAQAELESYLRTTNSALIRQLITRAQRGLEADAGRAPQDEQVANVVLERGLDGAGVATLLDPRSIALVGLAARCPTKSGRMPTEFEIAQPALGALTDGIAARVNGALERERRRFAQLAGRMSEGAGGSSPGSVEARELAAQYREVAGSSALSIYRLRVLGTRAALLDLSRAPNVRAVFVEENSQIVSDVRGIERESQAWRNPPSTTAIQDVPYPQSPPPAGASRPPASQWKRLPIPQDTSGAADHRALLFMLNGYAEPDDIERHFGKSHEQLRTDAKAIPHERRSAILLLRQTIDPDQARQFLEHNHFDLHGCMMRVPGAGTPLVMDLNQRALARWPGGIVHRIERATSDERMRYARRAAATANPAAREIYERAAGSADYQLFRLDVIGRVLDIARQLEGRAVLAIFYGPNAGSADDHEVRKRHYERVGVADEADPFD